MTVRPTMVVHQAACRWLFTPTIVAPQNVKSNRPHAIPSKEQGTGHGSCPYPRLQVQPARPPAALCGRCQSLVDEKGETRTAPPPASLLAGAQALSPQTGDLFTGRTRRQGPEQELDMSNDPREPDETIPPTDDGGAEPADRTAPKLGRPSPQEPARPSHIGRYRVERLLGKGGFGLVYLAHDEQLRRQVAIKVPHRELTAQPADVEAYLDEARMLAHLDDPHKQGLVHRDIKPGDAPSQRRRGTNCCNSSPRRSRS